LEAKGKLSEIIGLEEAKAVLREAVILPALHSDVGKLFWRSSDQSAVLLLGSPGMGGAAVAEAAAAEAGARVLSISAAVAASDAFCGKVLSTATAAKTPVMVLIEGIDADALPASIQIRHCFKKIRSLEAAPPPVFFVATSSRPLSPLALEPFGYSVKLELPDAAERKAFLLALFKQISRVDPSWASALRESSVATLANLTENYAFAEIDFVVRRAFVRSTNAEGGRDPIAVHHFEQILSETPPRALHVPSAPAPVADVAAREVVGEPAQSTAAAAEKAKKKEYKDPMDGIFGWCNMWLPSALQLPPVVWAMIIFGILAHFMARATYQPYGSRRRRGAGGRSSLFGDTGRDNPYSGFGGMPDLDGGMGGGMGPESWGFGANFPPPPGVAGLRPNSFMSGMPGAGGDESAAATGDR